MQQKGFVVLNQSASWNAYQEETALAEFLVDPDRPCQVVDLRDT
jgi:hypothetical protein